MGITTTLRRFRGGCGIFQSGPASLNRAFYDGSSRALPTRRYPLPGVLPAPRVLFNMQSAPSRNTNNTEAAEYISQEILSVPEKIFGAKYLLLRYFVENFDGRQSEVLSSFNN